MNTNSMKGKKLASLVLAAMLACSAMSVTAGAEEIQTSDSISVNSQKFVESKTPQKSSSSDEITVGAFTICATNDGDTLTVDVDYTYDESENTLFICSAKPITVRNTDIEMATTDSIVVKKDIDAVVTLAGVRIEQCDEKSYDSGDSSGCAFMVEDNSTGNVVVTLAEGTQNFLRSCGDYAGLQYNIEKSSSNYGTLTVNGTGSLEAACTEIGVDRSARGYDHTYGAGIGSGKGCKTNIVIEGGNITARGGYYGAGIGSGKCGPAGAAVYYSNVKITGGNINATGGYQGGAGIGCGSTSAVNVTINGGTIYAKGGYECAGIGGASYKATYSDTKEHYYWSKANVIINGGDITATSGSSGVGIGSGYGTDSVINIRGGDITIEPPMNYSGDGYTLSYVGIGQYSGPGKTEIHISGGYVAPISGAGFNIGNGSYSDGETSIDISGGIVFAKLIGQPSVPSNIGATPAKQTISKTAGIIFEYNAGRVYGEYELDHDLEIPEGYTLTNESDYEFTVNAGTTLTNNGTILNNGTINNNGNMVNKETGTFTNIGTLNNNRNKTFVNNGLFENKNNAGFSNIGTFTSDGELRLYNTVINGKTGTIVIDHDSSVTDSTLDGGICNKGTVYLPCEYSDELLLTDDSTKDMNLSHAFSAESVDENNVPCCADCHELAPLYAELQMDNGESTISHDSEVVITSNIVPVDEELQGTESISGIAYNWFVDGEDMGISTDTLMLSNCQVGSRSVVCKLSYQGSKIPSQSIDFDVMPTELEIEKKSEEPIEYYFDGKSVSGIGLNLFNVNNIVDGDENPIDVSLSWYSGDDLLETAPTEIGSYKCGVALASNDDNYAIPDEMQNFLLDVDIVDEFSKLSAEVDGTIIADGSNWYTSDVTVQAPDGYSISTDGAEWYDSFTIEDEGENNFVYYLKNNVSERTSDEHNLTVNIDKIAPEAEVIVKENSFKEFINKITFGLFFNDNPLVVNFSANDGVSGVAAAEYYIDENASEPETLVASLTTDDWVTVPESGSIELDRDGNYTIYYKVTDSAGLETIVNSDGVVVDKSAPKITANGVEVENNQTFCHDQTFVVDEKSLGKVTVNDEEVSVENGEFVIMHEGEESEILNAVIKIIDTAGNETEVSVKIAAEHNYQDGVCNNCGEQDPNYEIVETPDEPTDSDTESDEDTDTTTDSDTESDEDTDTTTDSDTESDEDTDTTTDSDTESDEDTDTTTDSDTESDEDTDTATDSDTESDEDTDTTTDSDTESDEDTDTATDSDTESDEDTDTTTDSDTESDDDTDTTTDSDTESDEDTDTTIDSDTESDEDTDTTTDSDTDSVETPDEPSDSDTESDVDTDTGTDTDSDSDSDTEYVEAIMGDVNRDGSVDLKDAYAVYRHSANLPNFVLEDDIEKILADVTGDGKVRSDDAIDIQRHIMGLPGSEAIGKTTKIEVKK